MERIELVLRNARPQTVKIITPATSPLRPNSRIEFGFQSPLASGAKAYAIFLANGVVYGQQILPTGPSQPEKLASNVTGLMFTGDATDPGIISVSLQIDVLYDTQRIPPKKLSLLIPNRAIHLAEAP